jgi:hypothetical protein
LCIHSLVCIHSCALKLAPCASVARLLVHRDATRTHHIFGGHAVSAPTTPNRTANGRLNRYLLQLQLKLDADDDSVARANRQRVFRVSVDSRDRKQWTPLHIAVFHKHTDLVALLMDHGADPHLVNAFGQNACVGWVRARASFPPSSPPSVPLRHLRPSVPPSLPPSVHPPSSAPHPVGSVWPRQLGEKVVCAEEATGPAWIVSGAVLPC